MFPVSYTHLDVYKRQGNRDHRNGNRLLQRTAEDKNRPIQSDGAGQNLRDRRKRRNPVGAVRSVRRRGYRSR